MTVMHTQTGLAFAALLVIGLATSGPGAAQTAPTDAPLIEQAQAPADWTAYRFRGFGFSLPAGWVEMERSDEQLILFGGNVETRSGPGFGLMLTDDPMEIFEPGKSTEAGQVIFANGQMFRRFTATETPEPGLTIKGDFLISLMPIAGQDYLVVLQSSYSEPLAQHRPVFDQILSSLVLPAPGEMWREPVLGGAFLAPLPEGWETGSYDDEEALIFEQKGLRGQISLLRHKANPDLGWLDEWYIPQDLQPLPVTMMGQPALLYEWTHDPKSLADGSDDDAISRVYVFETCLPGGDTASISLTGLPSFYDALPVQSLLDAIELPLGEGASACPAANLPQGAVTGTPAEGRRADSGFTTYIAANDRPDWSQQSFAGHGWLCPANRLDRGRQWTGRSRVSVFDRAISDFLLAYAAAANAPRREGRSALCGWNPVPQVQRGRRRNPGVGRAHRA